MADWMSEVPGELLASQLTIPGSHNSYCRYEIFTGLGWWGEDWAACQDKDNGIPEQLNSGIRFLDFRMENGGKIVHGIADTKGIFFSEFKVGKAACHGGDDPEQPHEVQWVVDELKTQFGASNFWFERKTPTLDEARGKIVFLTRWKYETRTNEEIRFDPGKEANFDITPGYRAQDHYDLTDHMHNDPTEYKFNQHIVPLMDIASRNAEVEKHVWFYNFLSAYAGDPLHAHLSPQTIARGNGKGTVGVNDYLKQWLGNNSGSYRLGILIVDFVTPDLARAIYTRNKRREGNW